MIAKVATVLVALMSDELVGFGMLKAKVRQCSALGTHFDEVFISMQRTLPLQVITADCVPSPLASLSQYGAPTTDGCNSRLSPRAAIKGGHGA